MPKWLVKLKGEKFDLEDFPSLLQSPELSVIEENGSYYLQSSKFNTLASADEVFQRGLELIERVNGAAKLYIDNFHDVAVDEVTHIEDDGRKSHHNVLQIDNIMQRQKVSPVTLTASNGSQPAVNQHSLLESCVHLSQKFKQVAVALHFYHEDSWVNLYKVYETIRDDISEDDFKGDDILINNGWVSRSELRRFKRTAQSKEALGDQARHASKTYTPPDVPMSHSETKSLVKSILMKWLATKSDKP